MEIVNMRWREPKNSNLYKWTIHSKEKMKHYGITESRVRSIIKNPLRIEKNFLDKIVLAVQPQSIRMDKKTNKKTWSNEIWVMYKYIEIEKLINLDIPEKFENLFKNQKSILIISAWKYPGVTRANENIPIEIENEIHESNNLSNGYYNL